MEDVAIVQLSGCPFRGQISVKSAFTGLAEIFTQDALSETTLHFIQAGAAQGDLDLGPLT